MNQANAQDAAAKKAEEEEQRKKAAEEETRRRNALQAARKELAALEKKFSGGAYNMDDVERADQLRAQLAGKRP